MFREFVIVSLLLTLNIYLSNGVMSDNAISTFIKYIFSLDLLGNGSVLLLFNPLVKRSSF